MDARLRAVIPNVLLIAPSLVGIALAVLLPTIHGCTGHDAAVDDAQRSAETVPAIDPALIQYEETLQFTVGMKEVRALAAGPEDRIYVGGDQAVAVYDAQGTRQSEIALDDRPFCLAVGDAEHAFPGRIYVGMQHRVEVCDPQGKRLATWNDLGEKSLITSIAVAEYEVFVADAGNKIVWRYDTTGKLLGQIGKRDELRKIPGFVITSGHFDLAVAPDGLLHVVNPRLLRIEAYTFDGDLEHHWGKSSPAIEGFFGCCNPAHFAVLPDGRYVTAEKGAARVKIYSAQGEFQCVVAGPKQLESEAADLAADSRGRVLVLDPKLAGVRVFEKK